MRHSEIRLAFWIGVENIYFGKSWLVRWLWKERSDTMTELALNAKTIRSSRAINRTIYLYSERRKYQCIVVVADIGTK